jgi:hypothetical protein
MLGLVTKPEVFVAAFDVFGDPLVARHLDGRRVDDQARRELELIKTIQDHESAKPKGKAHDAVTAALTEERAIK